jgi:hypothetical protein
LSLAYPYIQPLQTAALWGMKMCWDFFCWGDFNKKLVLQVIAEKMKILTYIVATSIGGYPELDLWIINHITLNFLSICVMIVAALAIFQTWICVEVSIGKCLNSIQ